MTLTLSGTGDGAWLGGSGLRWVHLLPVRSHLGGFLPPGGGHLRLRCPRSGLMEARAVGIHGWVCPLTPLLTPAVNKNFSEVRGGNVSMASSGGNPGGW